MDPDGPTSDRNVAFMRQNIDECITSHPECKRRTTKPTFVPRRLLDLVDCKSTSVRLIESGQSLSLPDPYTHLQYATLSYCWGGPPTMTTTKTNKSKHKTTGINIEDMPAIFQDAIRVAKKLNIRYLWIDALCIVQDDEDDWEAEAITMCDVFAHSQVTISAAKSSSSAEHFLPRQAEEVLSLEFRSTLKPDISGQYYIRLEPHRFWPGTGDLWGLAWRSRAWVWQEEVMSTRQVVFGKRFLQFRCSKGFLLEDGRRDHDAAMVLKTSMLFWYHAMRTYSSRRLTYPSDRLKAIAGAAKFLESRHREEGNPAEYLAGLWKFRRTKEWECDDFENQLRWVLRKRPRPSRRGLLRLLKDENRYIAPSWSWASLNAGVDCLVNGIGSEIRVIKTDLQASHKDSMVSVAFGSSITLWGKFRQTPVEPMSGHFVQNASRWSYRWEASSTYGCTNFWLDWKPKEDDEEEHRFQRELCLLLTTEIYDHERLGGLIISPVQDDRNDVLSFYRVGAFEHKGDKRMLMGLEERQLTIR